MTYDEELSRFRDLVVARLLDVINQLYGMYEGREPKLAVVICHTIYKCFGRRWVPYLEDFICFLVFFAHAHRQRHKKYREVTLSSLWRPAVGNSMEKE